MDGLNQEEVKSRMSEGKVNRVPGRKTGRTVPEIILTNVFTFFNLLNIFFFVLILLVGAYKNGLFIFTIVFNTLIGIIQELRTKRELDKVRLLTQPTSSVIRDGISKRIPNEEIVLDDVLELRTGDEIPADAVLLSGFLELNEAMLTGEEDTVRKEEGAELLSGTFVTAGNARARVVHVGKDNYVESISGEVRKFKKAPSKLRDSLNMILKIVSFVIIPLVFGLFLRLHFTTDSPLRDVVVSIVTSGIGMIPEGLFLLTTVALSMGAVRLARKRTVTKDLYSIESLARVDILCLDKTGTLTEGRMNVEKTVPFVSEELFNESFRQVLSALQSENATSEALSSYFGKAETVWKYDKLIPFSSQRKCSGVQFTEQGLLMIGAAQILCRKDVRLLKEITPFAQEGLRVLVLCRSSEHVSEDLTLPDNVECLGYAVLSDVLRKDCHETLDFFRKQDVKLLCISGDDAQAVSRIASRAGLEHAEDYADLSLIKDDDALRTAVREKTVFGRVTPEQKKRIIQMLKEDGHTVAMTGDGVNDVLAMKEADCSIAMASGSEVTKHTANVVLLDSDFAAMPSIVNEGRRVINNIMNASSMYLIKTIFSAILTLGTIILGGAYPVDAVHLTVISATAVGAPTFFMQFEPTFTRIRNDFMVRVFRNAVPAALIISLVCLLVTRIGKGLGEERDVLVTICFLAIGMIYFFMLRRIYSPLSKYRKVIAYSMEIIYIIVVFLGRSILSLKAIPFAGIILILAVVALTPPLVELLEILYDKATKHINRKGAVHGQENTVV